MENGHTYKQTQLQLPSGLNFKGLTATINRQHSHGDAGLSFCMQPLPNFAACELCAFLAC